MQPSVKVVVEEIRKRGFEMVDYIQQNFSIPEDEKQKARHFLKKKFAGKQLHILLTHLKSASRDKAVKKIILNQGNCISNQEAEAFFQQTIKILKKTSKNTLFQNYVEQAEGGKILTPKTIGALLIYIIFPCFEMLVKKNNRKTHYLNQKTSVTFSF